MTTTSLKAFCIRCEDEFFYTRINITKRDKLSGTVIVQRTREKFRVAVTSAVVC